MGSDTALPPYARRGKNGAWLVQVRVQPGAKRSEVIGLLDDRLKIRIAAPPVDSKANSALIEFIATALGLRQSRVTLSSGATSRQKNIAIESATEPDWTKLL